MSNWYDMTDAQRQAIKDDLRVKDGLQLENSTDESRDYILGYRGRVAEDPSHRLEDPGAGTW